MSDNFREVAKKVDVVSRQAAIDEICDIRCGKSKFDCESYKNRNYISDCDYIRSLLNLPSTQPEAKTNANGDWVILNKDKILKAGMEGREVKFRIGGRLFAIVERKE